MSSFIPDEDLIEIHKRLNSRDRLLTAILRLTGFRLDDLMHCRVWQLRDKALTLKERKTGNVRSVDLPSEISEHFKKRPVEDAFCYAFPALRRGGRGKMHRTTYWRHFVAAAKAAGFEDRGYTPHGLRKSYAVELYHACKSLTDVQEDLGHKSMATTMVYALSDKIAF